MAPGGAILMIVLLMVSTGGANQQLILVYQGNAGYIHIKSCGRKKISMLRKIADYLALLLLAQGIEPNPGPAAEAFSDNAEVSKKRQIPRDITTSKDPNPMTKTCLDIYHAKIGSISEACATTEYIDIVSGAPYLVRGLVGLKTSLDLSESKPRATSTPMSSPLGMTEDESTVSINDLSAIEELLPSVVTAPSVNYKPTSQDVQYSVKFNNFSYAMMDRYLDNCTKRAIPRGRKSYDDSLLEISYAGVLNCERLKKRHRQEEKARRQARKIDERQTETSYIKARMSHQGSQEEGYYLTPRQVKKRIGKLKRLLARKQIFDEEPMWVPVVRLVPHPSPVPYDDDDDDDDEFMERSFTPSGILFHDTPGMAYLAALAEKQEKEQKGRYVDTVEESYGLSVFYQAASDYSNKECAQDKQEAYITDDKNKNGHWYDDIKLEYMDLFYEQKRKTEKSSQKKYFDQQDATKVTAKDKEKTTGIVKFFKRFVT